MKKLMILLGAGLFCLGFTVSGGSAKAGPLAPDAAGALAPTITSGSAVQPAQWGPPPRRWRGPPPRRWRGPPPRRFGPPPPPRRYYGAPRPWTPAWYAYCSSKYRSFDPRSGTYQPYNGPRRLCR